MKGLLAVVILLASCSSGAYALDGFESVKCGANIPNVLIGKHMLAERVVVIEGRHKELGLKDLGGLGISERLFLHSWLICGSEYQLLEEARHDDTVVRDVVLFPPHSKSTPEFMGTCRVEDHEISDAIVAVLDNQAGQRVNGPLPRPLLPAKTAWKIDEGKARFVKIGSTGLRCPVDGIITVDSIY